MKKLNREFFIFLTQAIDLTLLIEIRLSFVFIYVIINLIITLFIRVSQICYNNVNGEFHLNFT